MLVSQLKKSFDSVFNKVQPIKLAVGFADPTLPSPDLHVSDIGCIPLPLGLTCEEALKTASTHSLSVSLSPTPHNDSDSTGCHIIDPSRITISNRRTAVIQEVPANAARALLVSGNIKLEFKSLLVCPTGSTSGPQKDSNTLSTLFAKLVAQLPTTFTGRVFAVRHQNIGTLNFVKKKDAAILNILRCCGKFKLAVAYLTRTLSG